MSRNRPPQYSHIYQGDDGYEYRHVHLGHGNNTDRLLPRSEWRRLGIKLECGWEHYAWHKPEPHILLFRRAIPPGATTPKIEVGEASEGLAMAVTGGGLPPQASSPDGSSVSSGEGLAISETSGGLSPLPARPDGSSAAETRGGLSPLVASADGGFVSSSSSLTKAEATGGMPPLRATDASFAASDGGLAPSSGGLAPSSSTGSGVAPTTDSAPSGGGLAPLAPPCVKRASEKEGDIKASGRVDGGGLVLLSPLQEAVEFSGPELESEAGAKEESEPEDGSSMQGGEGKGGEEDEDEGAGEQGSEEEGAATESQLPIDEALARAGLSPKLLAGGAPEVIKSAEVFEAVLGRLLHDGASHAECVLALARVMVIIRGIRGIAGVAWAHEVLLQDDVWQLLLGKTERLCLQLLSIVD